MKTAAFAFFIGSGLAWGQTAPLGDVYSSGSGQAESPEAAYRKLYELTAQITDDPSAGYQTPKGDQTGWPAEAAAEKEWDASMAADGNTLSPEQRAKLAPGAAHLNAAIDDMERGYRIEINPGNAPNKEQTVQKLYTEGRKEFAECNSSGALNDGVADSGTPGSNSSSPPSTADGTAPQLQQLAAQMQEIAQESQQSANTAIDHFVGGLATWAKNTGTLMAQKPGVPVSQMSQALWQYLNNDHNENDAKLRAAAVEALKQFQEDPARFLGENLPNLLPMPKVKWLRQIASFEKGAQRISAAAKIERQFASAWGTNGLGRRAAAPLIFAENACVSTALAQDQLWATNESFRINGVHQLGRPNLLTNQSELLNVLRSRYPRASSLSSLFTPGQRIALGAGSPIRATQAEIENFMRNRPGSRGLVFVRSSPSQPGHVFNVRNYNNTIEYLDVPGQQDGRWWLDSPTAIVSFFPTG